MLNKIVQIFKIRDLRQKILVILFIFGIFRFLAHIPVPGIEIQNLKAFFEEFRMLGILNIFTGGALERISIVMLGVGPYITAVVILQLLTMIFPSLEKMYKEEGQAGREKFEQYGRILTVPLAILQSFGMLMFFSSQQAISKMSPISILISSITVAAGTVFLMWLGEIITEKGIGNGVSLLIFAGIVTDFPANVGALIQQYHRFSLMGLSNFQIFLNYLLFFLMVVVILIGVTLITEARREIPITFAKRVRGRLLYGGASTYLPLSINPAGVMPIIFALSLLTLPSMVVNFLAQNQGKIGMMAKNISGVFESEIFFGTLYFVLVFVFTYFYTMITFDPKSIAENLQKSGGFIPGVRPGEQTERYLTHTLNRILPFGALFLGLIAIMPNIVQAITKVAAFHFLVGGTSILILVSVALETIREINAQLKMREYETL